MSSRATGEVLDRFYAGEAKYIDNVTRGPDGRVWFTHHRGLGAVDAGGRVTLYRLPGVEPVGLAAGPDGALWLTDLNRGGVVRRDATGTITRFPALTDHELPGEIAAGPDGNLWYTIGRGLARVTPTGIITAYRRLPKGTRPQVLAAGPDSAMWFAWDYGVGRMTTTGDVRLWRLTDDEQFPESIVLGPDGNLWIGGWVELSNELVGYDELLRVTPAGEVTTVKAGDQVSDVTVGPDGNLWFSYYYGVGRVAPDGTGLVRWPEPFGGGTDCSPYSGLGPDAGLAFDATGTLWAGSGFTRSLVRVTGGTAEPSPLEPFLRADGALARRDSIALGLGGQVWISARRAIVRVDADGRRTVFRRGIGRRPGDMVAGANGSVWYTAGRGINRLAANGRVRRYRRGFHRRSYLSTLTRGPDGNFWFVDRGRRAIGRMTAGGHVREFSRGIPRHADLRAIASGRRHLWVTDSSGAVIRVSTSGRLRRVTRGLHKKADPTGITRGPDGEIWFTEFRAHRIGTITTHGRVREYRVHENPASITSGPDGALWFTTATADDIDTTAGLGRITLGGRVHQFYAHQTCRGRTRGLITGPDRKLWFIEPHGPIAVGRLDPQRLIATGALPPANTSTNPVRPRSARQRRQLAG